jgi:hypothetical protein
MIVVIAREGGRSRISHTASSLTAGCPAYAGHDNFGMLSVKIEKTEETPQ